MIEDKEMSNECQIKMITKITKLKQCSKCGKLKDKKAEFYQRKDFYCKLNKTYLGIRTTCKICWKKKAKKYRRKNTDRIKAYTDSHKENRKQYDLLHQNEIKEYRKLHAEKFRKYRKRYRKLNKIRLQKLNRIWRELHKDELKIKKKNYANFHRDEIRIQNKRWRKKNKTYLKKYLKKWYRENPEKEKLYHQRKTALQRIGGPLTAQMIQEVYENNIKRFGTLTCIYCLKSIRFGNDSLEHKQPISKGGANNYENLAIACKPCNFQKRNKTEKEFKRIMKNG